MLKMYFRELPNPLCTYHLYHRFVGAVQAPHGNRLALMREVVKSLPPPHYRTLEYLMKHLARVAQRGGETGMTPRNVAIVWAPNLLRCKELEVGGVAALQGVGVQAVVTEFLVCYADLIFGTTEKGALAQRLRQRPAQHLSPDQHKLPPDVSPNLVAAFAAENGEDSATPKRSRPKSLAISTPTKLLSLEEARTRALLAATGKADQEYIEVVIDVPARKRGSLKSKRSPGLGWKAFFSKKVPLQQRQQSSSSLTSKRNILGGGYSPGAAGATASSQLRGMVSPSELRTQEKAMTESDLMQNRRRLRPVKSAESLSSAVASAGSSTRNSAALDLEIGLGSIEGVLDQITGQSSSAMIGDTGLPSSPSVTGKPSHSRSVSHDSYFDHLAEPVLLMTEDDVEQEEEGELGESENLDGLLDLSEIQLDFELEEREMRIFSEDETLVSTTPIGSGGSLSRSPLLPHPSRRRLIGSPQGSGPRARPEDTGSSADPSPKKKKSGTSAISPGARKRSKVEAKSKAVATSSSPSPVSSPLRSAPVRPPSSSMPSVGQRSCFGGDDEDEEEELRFIDSQSPEPMPPSTTSFHRTSPTSYMSRQSSHSPSSNHNHYSQPYQQQQVVVHAEVHPSPSEDASSLSRADATVSDNESFTVHGGETSSEGDLPAEAGGTHPENEDEEDDEDEGGVLYTPLVNDATAETTPVEQSTPAYENVPWVRGQTGALNGDDQITTNLLEKRKCPAATPRNLDSAPIGRVYQNIGSSYSENHEENNDEAVYEEVQVIKDKSDLQRTTSPISSVTRRNDVASTSSKNNASKKGETDPEEVYQQVKAFRKSVQEVNEILGGVPEQTQLPKMDGQQNKTLGSEDSVQNSREAPSAANEQCAMVKEVSVNSELLSSSNGSSEESSEGRMPSEEMALLRTPSGRSGLSVSGTNRRASLPASSTSSFTEDSHRRRFDSEIGRDILRERRVKLELERVRGEPGSGVSSPVSSDGTGTRLTPSPVSTPQRTLSPAPPKSPASMQTSERHSPAPSASSASTVPPRSPVPPQSPAPPRSPAPSSSPVPSHSPAHSRSPAFSHSSAPPRSPAPSSSSAPSHSPAPVHSPVPSLSPLPPQSPAPCSSPVFSRSPAPPLSPASPRSPIPPISPASPHSPLPVRSPLSPLPPYSPITHSPALSPISPTTPKSPSYPLALSPTNSVNSPSHVASTSIGASCLRSPTIPMDLPSGPNSSSSSPARTPFKKNDENHRLVNVGTSLTDVTADCVKNSSAKKDSAIKTLENGFESGCRGWGSEGGSLRGLPGRSWSVSDSRRLAVRKASVRELLSRFEGKEGGEGEEKSGRRASAPSHRRPTPPCLRARASRSSPASALSVSLDEERFLASAREATNSPSKSGEIPTCNESPSKGDGQLIRVRTSPDINTEAEDSEEQSLLMEQQSDSTGVFLRSLTW
ncbi:hypothetical protein J437_LFUL007723 [Ladona fulva]|uniref:Rho-GAP domain-containing protein n=1 Tax=Ladona fulva TaxID=123851 RepID=A0A8K0K136_LADFU|nr:hypothetical protein J437_LFUL007723 [Ladona fulva]